MIVKQSENNSFFYNDTLPPFLIIEVKIIFLKFYTYSDWSGLFVLKREFCKPFECSNLLFITCKIFYRTLSI